MKWKFLHQVLNNICMTLRNIKKILPNKKIQLKNKNEIYIKN